MDPTRKRTLFAYAAVAVVAAAAAALIAALLVNISERKQEAKRTFVKLVEVGDDDVDPKKWGVNWPRQYDGYRRTSDATATKYGGGLVGPEGSMPPEKAARDPWLSRIFAGYLFAVDYRDRRGHGFMLQDQAVTRRNVPGEGKQSGNCLHCHASIMPLYRKLGREALPGAAPAEQVQKGLDKVGEMEYWDAHKLLADTTGGAHPVSCVDCHDPKTMELRVTRPGFIAGIGKLAASSAPVPHLPSVERWRSGNRAIPYDPNTDGTRQEMRSFVCGQCHVEYYCGKGTTLLFPWDNGLKVEQIEQTYDAMTVKGHRFYDWIHAETGMPVLKAQHPEFEVWSQGIHARSGVACADCHMPYKREGAMKVSEHWVRSPLLEVNRSCATCHPYGEREIEARVLAIQDRHFALLDRAGKAAVAMIDAIVVASKSRPQAPDTDPDLKELGELQRAAQWRLDFVAAENSMGFHAPQELARILGESIDFSRQAQAKAMALTAPK
jgi:nitrite reductase (cytochrome c-552)